MARQIFLSLIILVLLSGMSSALETTSVKINSDIQDSFVYVDYVINLYNNGSGLVSSYKFTLPSESSIIYAKDDYGDLGYIDNDPSKGFTFPLPVAGKERRTILLKIRTKSLITDKEDFYEYVFDSPDIKAGYTEVSVKLPEDTVVEGNRLMKIFPESGIDYFLKRPFVVWKNPEKGTVFLVRFRRSSINYIAWIVSSMIIIIILVATLFMLIRVRKIRAKKRMLSSVKILNEKEKRVVNAIIEKEGINQYELMKILGLNKSNLSKIIKKLDFNGIIEKKSMGKINKLYIGEKLKKQ